jgi:hypothetical protein
MYQNIEEKCLSNQKIYSKILLLEYDNIIVDKMNKIIMNHSYTNSKSFDPIYKRYFYLKENNEWKIDISKMPYTKKITNLIFSQHYQFDRIAYRQMNPFTNYRFHKDASPNDKTKLEYRKNYGQKGNGECYHIPIKTNDYCMFLYEDKFYKLKENRLYRINNNVKHTFLNAGNDERIHLIFEKIL